VINPPPSLQRNELHHGPSLLEAAQGGDAEAFSTLVREHLGRLLAQATALCRDPHLAEDLVQETLLEAWKHLRRFDGSCRLSTWLYSILLHRHQKALRHARIRPFFCLGHEERDAALSRLQALEGGPDEALEQKEASGQLLRRVHRLSPKHREVILLRFFGEASLEEIAHALHCSVGTIKSRLFHALEKLKSSQKI